MWVAKIKFSGKGTLIGSKTPKYKVNLFGFPLSYFYEKNWIVVHITGTIFGKDEDKKKFIKELKREKRTIGFEVNDDFFIGTIKEPLIAKIFYNKDIFYNQPEIETLSLPMKLMAFYIAYWPMVPEMMLAKIRYGFGGYMYLTIAMILIGAQLVNQLIINKLKKINKQWHYWTKGGLLIGVIFWLVHIWQNKIMFFNPTKALFKVEWLLIGLSLVMIGIKLSSKKKLRLKLPVPFLILFCSLLLITLTTLGWPRYIQVIDWLFMLLAIKYGFDFIIDEF